MQQRADFRVIALILGALAGPGSLSSAAAAELYETISPNQMLALMQGEKGSAELRTVEDDTTIEGRVDSLSYTVYFYECDGGEFVAPAKPDSACTGLEYRAYFNEYPSDSDTVNAWNAEHHFGKLWRDEDDDLALNLTVTLEGGITDGNIRISFALWRTVLESLETFMSSWKGASK